MSQKPVDKRTSLTEDQIIEIYLSKAFIFELEKKYNVSRTTIWRIQKGQRHRNITAPFAAELSWDNLIEQASNRVKYYAQRHDEAQARLNAMLNVRSKDPDWQIAEREKREYQERKREQRKEQSRPNVLTIRPTADYFSMPMPEEIGGYGDRD